MGDYDSAPESVELNSLQLGGWESEHLRVELRFGDGTTLAVEFERQSRETAEVLDLVAQLVNDALRRRGLSGVEITGVTDLEDEE
jgi:hypothetical protein